MIRFLNNRLPCYSKQRGISTKSFRTIPLIQFNSTFKNGTNSTLVASSKRTQPLQMTRNFSNKRTYQTLSRWVVIFLKEFLPGKAIIQNYNHPQVAMLVKSKVDLHIYMPDYRLAFECIGHGQLQENLFAGRQKADESKRNACKKAGITLIDIPYWWDIRRESLKATINKYRPDVIKEPGVGSPIPSEPKEETLSSSNLSKAARDIAKSYMTAKIYKQHYSPAGWWLTEMYDGVRALWDGSNFYGRVGRDIYAPEFFKQSMPNETLDGELWYNYNGYHEICEIIKNENDPRWKNVKYKIFDAPKLNDVIESRIDYMNNLKLPKHAKVVEFVKCIDKLHIENFSVKKEGVVLRAPNSKYESGRSDNFLKWKPTREEELKIIGKSEEDTLICEQPNGKYVQVPYHPLLFGNDQKPKVDSVITVYHSGYLDSGKVARPQFRRFREDLSWVDVQEIYSLDEAQGYKSPQLHGLFQDTKIADIKF